VGDVDGLDDDADSCCASGTAAKNCDAADRKTEKGVPGVETWRLSLRTLQK